MSPAMDLTAVIRAMRDAFELLDLPSIEKDNHGRELFQQLDQREPLDVQATDLGPLDFEDVPL